MSYSEERPRPEELLEALKKEEAEIKRGRLKIFLGAAAGVGKTFSMLKEAQKLQQEKIDVVVGVVDTHNRKETAELLKNLKIVPEKKLYYKNKEFKELDIDAVIALNPEVVLVDELAHHNVPGSKHTKRWQDVLDLLDHGIDVYTTLNVQHIESLNDIIHNITDVAVRETVPDHIIEMASSIQLVDLTPDELLQRLKEGKVYFDEQSKIASLHFFQKEKLTALREIALRYAADKVDHDLRSMAEKEEKMIDWRPREKILTAISDNPHSQKLIRTARRISTALDAPWIAVHVNDGSLFNEKENDQLAKNFALARDLGAEVITINDPHIANGIKRVVKQSGITRIILGRSKETFFSKFIKGFSLVEKLTDECKEADIHIIREDKNPVYSRKRRWLFSFQTKWQDYFSALVSVGLFSFFSWFSLGIISYKIIGIIFPVILLLLSLFLKRGAVFFAALLFAAIWGIFFIPPEGTISISSQEDIVILIIYIVTALTIGILVTREKEHKEMLEKSEESTRALYEMVNQIAVAPSLEAILKCIKERFDRLLYGTFEFVLKNIDNEIDLSHVALISNEKEKNTALWAFTNGQEAGFSTDTLPFAENLYIPLKGYHDKIGLLLYRPKAKHVLTTEEKNFIYTVCRQLSHYLERQLVREKAYLHENLLQTQKIQKMILDRFSQAFQWPLENAKKSLVAIKKQLPNLQEILDLENSLEVFSKNLINLTTLTNLSDGMLPLKKEALSVEELIEDCTLFATPLLKNHTFKISIEEGLPKIPFDYFLIQLVLNNLIINAIEYSFPETTIEIKAQKANGMIQISISNEGQEIKESHLIEIFEKFYRLPSESLPRLGLGLGIAKTIAELHDGYMKAENLPGKGTCFSVFLPIQ